MFQFLKASDLISWLRLDYVRLKESFSKSLSDSVAYLNETDQKIEGLVESYGLSLKNDRSRYNKRFKELDARIKELESLDLGVAIKEARDRVGKANWFNSRGNAIPLADVAMGAVDAMASIVQIENATFRKRGKFATLVNGDYNKRIFKRDDGKTVVLLAESGLVKVWGAKKLEGLILVINKLYTLGYLVKSETGDWFECQVDEATYLKLVDNTTRKIYV